MQHFYCRKLEKKIPSRFSRGRVYTTKIGKFLILKIQRLENLRGRKGIIWKKRDILTYTSSHLMAASKFNLSSFS